MTVDEQNKAKEEIEKNLQILTPEEKVVLKELWYKINLKSIPKDYPFFGAYSSYEKFFIIVLSLAILGMKKK